MGAASRYEPGVNAGSARSCSMPATSIHRTRRRCRTPRSPGFHPWALRHCLGRPRCGSGKHGLDCCGDCGCVHPRSGRISRMPACWRRWVSGRHRGSPGFRGASISRASTSRRPCMECCRTGSVTSSNARRQRIWQCPQAPESRSTTWMAIRPRCLSVCRKCSV